MRAFAFTVFVSALLLFMVEPLIGKALLPWFGGTPGVWSACLLFFQLSMLAGYAYAHHLVSRLAPATQLRVHLIVVGVALAALGAQALVWNAPILPGIGLKPPDSAWPTLRLLLLLTVSVGLPFFVLSTTGPLAQAWFARAYPGAPTYRLYALSNVGSLLALLGYPFLVEPNLTLTHQAWLWAGAFGLFVIGVALVGRAVARAPSPAVTLAREPIAPVRPSTFLLWTALASVPSIMLLAVTNQLSQEVAVSPFLWVLPLAFYLLSFILTFESTTWYGRRRVLTALVPLLVAGFVITSRQDSLPVAWQVAGLLAVLFAASLFCHGELAGRRPPVQQLTTFYLAVSLGGAVGALTVPLLAPLLFRNYYELDVSFILTWLLAMVVLAADQRSAFFAGRARLARGGAAAYLFLLLLLVALRVEYWDQHSVAGRRNFYGVLKVAKDCDPVNPALGCVMVEISGRTTHGSQRLDAEGRGEATTYFTLHSGIGRAWVNSPVRLSGRPMRVGVVGLGAGTLASYGRAGDLLRFYEINPAALEFARAGSPYFSFLSDTAARVEVVLGDARLSMERELEHGGPQRYDLLVVDAFSSDAVPTHLLTREAFELYRAHLAGPEAILAIHVSNRNLDLAPVVWAFSDLSGMACRQLMTRAPPNHPHEATAQWMLLSATPAILDAPGIVGDGGDVVAHGRAVAPWTDDFTNVLALLR